MKYPIIVIVFLSFFCLKGNSQVTIGVDEEPVHGAILQLKDQKNVAVGGVNATRGLLLPRVHLTDLNSLIDIIPDSEDRPDPNVHIGLTVYNMNEDACSLKVPLRRGVYMWNGNTWSLAGAAYDSRVQIYKDQDGNEFRASQFGSAGVWMIENLRATKYANNLGGAYLTESLTAGATARMAYTYPGLNKSNFDANPSIGLLYEWDAATNQKTIDAVGKEFVNGVEKSKHNEGNHLQGICPEGWHIPTMAEWIELEKEIIKNSSQYSSLTNLTEPVGGLDPTDPFDGQIGLGEESILIYDRGNHGMAMSSKCNPPGITDTNISKGNILFDGGFSAMMAGCAWGTSTVSDTYGRESYFHTGSVVDFGKSPAIYGYAGLSIFSGDSDNVGVSTRTPFRTDNGGYLTVRCKKN